eukprot:TRINITY_DN2362_c0_g1_i2.p1 TRINITY_DN2362_c0_g1~~TRINITY_DN2362_c0_g1_i2.p1  ORF type:complete len:584 (+),score=-63.01 TRINITY_DN2362_c0_g1_i2:629-2380(+)
MNRERYGPASLSGGSSKRNRILIGTLLGVFLVAAVLVVVSVAVAVRRGREGGKGDSRSVTKIISNACQKTLYPDLCVSTLMAYPDVQSVRPGDLAHISANASIRTAEHAYFAALDGARSSGGTVKVPFDDCLELIDDTLAQLNESVTSIVGIRPGSPSMKTQVSNVKTWLSAAITNLDTCTEGFQNSGAGKQLRQQAEHLSSMISNTLSLFGTMFPDSAADGFPLPDLGNRRRRRLLDTEDDDDEDEGFPSWMSVDDRRLLSPAPGVKADAVVAADGSGDHRSIAEAVKSAPSKSDSRYIIYVKAGIYRENVTISRTKTNIMLIGDGKDKTVVTSGRSVLDGFTTYRSATFGASGKGFVARDMTFVNSAGPGRHQAVAFRLGSDMSAIFRCSFVGYQDTLYVHSQRQFFRECDIFGTVDFIFGNAAVVLQKCNIYPRKPMPNQKNTITAQNRKDPNQNTGISIHDCKLLPATDLAPVKHSYGTYLGRPWKMYARTVYMQTYMDDFIDPAGWLPWNQDFALKTLYYGEYMNSGPGAGLARRVTWPGYHVITSADEASQFTVAQFISGMTWLPATGIAYVAGLVV